MLPQMLQEAKDMIMRDSAEYQDSRIDREAKKIIAKGKEDFEFMNSLFESSDTLLMTYCFKFISCTNQL